MYQLSILILISSFLAVGAFVFSCILTSPDHLLGKLDAWAERSLPEYLYKPFIGCQYCVAGQWALWYYFVLCFITHELPYRLDIHILFILITIFIEEIVTSLYYKIIKS